MPIRKTAPKKVVPRKRVKKQKSEDLIILDRNLKRLENKPRHKGSISRRLRSLDEIHDTDETAETLNMDQRMSNNNNQFKVPSKPINTERVNLVHNDYVAEPPRKRLRASTEAHMTTHL